MLRQELTVRTRAVLLPVAKWLASRGVSADSLTVAGFLTSLLAGAAFATGRFALGALILLASGLCDVLDGSVARVTATSSRAGAFLDSTVDRYSELAIYLGLAVHYRGKATLVAILLAMAGAAQVSYTRARAEGLGEECRVGAFQRPERTVSLIVGGLLGPTGMRWVLWGLAIMTHVTSLQRMVHVAKRLKQS